jgi:hypothetical protein
MDRHVSYIGELRNAYKGLGVKFEGKKVTLETCDTL